MSTRIYIIYVEVILEDLICIHTYEYTHIYNIRVEKGRRSSLRRLLEMKTIRQIRKPTVSRRIWRKPFLRLTSFSLCIVTFFLVTTIMLIGASAIVI